MEVQKLTQEQVAELRELMIQKNGHRVFGSVNEWVKRGMGVT